MRAVVYARCSTDEKRQDVEVQLAELRRYCQAFGWAFDEVAEYDSGFTGEQPKLRAVLEKIHRGTYQALLVYSLDRFSRQAPSKTNRMLDALVEQDRCRFISRLEGIDSENELIWHAIRPLFAYFANLFSRNLSEKIRAGIRIKRQNGQYRGGRPPKGVDLDRLKTLLVGEGIEGWRTLARAYNENLPKRQHLSASSIRRVCQKHALLLKHELCAN